MTSIANVTSAAMTTNSANNTSVDYLSTNGILANSAGGGLIDTSVQSFAVASQHRVSDRSVDKKLVAHRRTSRGQRHDARTVQYGRQ